MLKKHNILSVLVPALCTDRLQPFDLSVNKAAKSFLQSQFQQWYSDKVMAQLDSFEDAIEPVDITIKSIGAECLSTFSQILQL